MMEHGHNCMKHGYVETMNCPRCDAADQKLREEGFKLGYDAGYLQGLEAAALECEAQHFEADWTDCAKAIRNLKPKGGE